MIDPDAKDDVYALDELSEKLTKIEAAVVVATNTVRIATGQRTDALTKARQHYQYRRKRDVLFDNPNLFGEPAWDILVDLFIAAEERKKISVSSLCIAAAVPATTALRWITLLENFGLILRNADRNDARRFYLSLSEAAHAKIKKHFDDMEF
jgi:DNA-binding MarR family transcriptional regulator